MYGDAYENIIGKAGFEEDEHGCFLFQLIAPTFGGFFA